MKRREALIGKLTRIEDAIDRQGEMLSKGGDRKFYSDKITNLNALHSKYKSELDSLQDKNL